MSSLQGSKEGITAQERETNLLAKNSRFARSKLLGEKADIIEIPCTTSENGESEDDEDETILGRPGSDKENCQMKTGDFRVKPDIDSTALRLAFLELQFAFVIRRLFEFTLCLTSYCPSTKKFSLSKSIENFDNTFELLYSRHYFLIDEKIILIWLPRKIVLSYITLLIRIHRLKESRKAYSILERQRVKERVKEQEHKAAVRKLREDSERDRALAEELVNQVRLREYDLLRFGVYHSNTAVVESYL